MKIKFRLLLAAALALVIIPFSVFSASADTAYNGGDDDGTVHFASAELAGDVNDDGVVNVSDLVRLKKVCADVDISYNALNAEIDGNSLQVNGGDLVALCKILLS